MVSNGWICQTSKRIGHKERTYVMQQEINDLPAEDETTRTVSVFLNIQRSVQADEFKACIRQSNFPH